MCKKFLQWFKKKEPYTDPEQKEYRELFNIIDDYLIEYSIEQEDGNNNKTGYIVYIDPVNDIDWKDTRTKKDWTPEEKRQWSHCIAKLNNAHAEPIGHLSFATIRTFKLKLGAGYVLAMNRCFDDVDRVIEDALGFLRHRHTEKSRQLFLMYSLLCLMVFLGLWSWNSKVLLICEDWALTILFGTMGSFFSIWSRYGKLTMTGLSSKLLHFLETFTRMIIGAISASVMLLSLKCGIILTTLAETAPLWSCGLIGFASGFSERIVPSLVEVLSKQITNDESQHEY